uniref:glutathione S-transferase family protein n=1 Tax=Marinobacterium profundum TaxID=1714300 RepID=UPI000A4BBD6E|nr:glutathione S-transferase [Marinobacterium profundum]
MAIKIHDFPLSGHAHRARLFASLIGVDVELVFVDLAAGEHKTPEYLHKDKFGQVPLLEDGDTIVADSNAILVYLAKKFGKTDWLPEDPKGAAQVQRWLSIAAGQIAYGPAAARLITLFGAKLHADEVIARAHAVLKIINEELRERLFITGNNITIADVALYSYIASAPEGNVELSPYGNINSWLARIEALPGFLAFPQSNVGLRKSA